MSRKNIWLLALSLLAFSELHAQSRTAGRMVVPRGYEKYDSLRVYLGDIGKLAGLGDAMANAIADSLQCTMEFAWENSSSTMLDLKGKRKGVIQADVLTSLTEAIKQRYYYALPFQIPYAWTTGYFWRYNAVNFNPLASDSNNTYDANDISPFSTYPASHDSVIKTYHTQRWLNNGSTIVDSVLSYGEEGQPILAYNDDRFADHLMLTDSNTFFPQGPGGKADDARTFSTTLDFNIDCDDSSHIDTTGAEGRNVNDLPLLKLQVLYKQGDQLSHGYAGWPVQPFTPFRDASHANTLGAGWYKVTNITVTRRTYEALDSCWKKEDRLENGSPAHAWVFKQLHVLLQDVPSSLDSLNLANRADSDWWGHDWGAPASSTPIATFMLPDSIVNVDALGAKTSNLLEFRVLSTYRATVRVRGMAWEDTIADKYLYRKRTNDTTTISLNPDGTPGGFDTDVDTLLSGLKSAGAPNEFLINDVDHPVAGGHASYSFAMLGYADYMGSKHSMAPHYREQEWNGNVILQLRRNRLEYDGLAPSIFENQEETPIASEK